MYQILLVEDEKETARLVKEGLEMEEMDVDIAYDGQTGLKMFRDADYDLILLDLKMPKMNGEELLREIRKDNPYVDIIVYTNNGEYENVPKLVNLGINGYIKKGGRADLDELIDMVKAKLEPMDKEEMKRLISHTEEIQSE